jgi:hypothetical protein
MTASLLRLAGCASLAALLVSACAPAATPAPPTAVVVAATLAPTQTPLPPTATDIPPTATASVVPATATPLPPTATEPPTATPEPQPGDVLFNTSEGDCRWSGWGFLFDTDEEVEDFPFTEPDGGLQVEVPEANSTFYAHCSRNLGTGDVQIDAEVVAVAGPNFNGISVLCRYSPKGWYEGMLDSGGYWSLLKYSEDEGWVTLDQGASTAIHMQKARNHLTLVCEGDTISFYINDVEMGSVSDTDYTRGLMAVSVTSFDLPGVVVRFDEIVVSVPDPDNRPGGLVAPTVPPPANTPAPPAASSSGCQIVSVQPVSTLGPNVPGYAFVAQGFGPGEIVMVYLTGNFTVAGVTQPITALQRFDADGQGRVQGQLAFGVDFGPPQGQLVLYFEGACTTSTGLTWP